MLSDEMRTIDKDKLEEECSMKKVSRRMARVNVMLWLGRLARKYWALPLTFLIKPYL
jgi:hypothetical protein